MLIRALTMDDIEAYLVHSAASSSESGRDGDVYFGPYRRDEPFVVEEARERTRQRWSKSITTTGWRRAWGAFEGDRIVGSASVTGSELESGLHRVTLGMAVLRGYRRQGIGRRLLEEVIAWCRNEPAIAWLDLGVFGDNAAARALYREMGFEEIGVTRDRFRMDGNRIDDVAMTLSVEKPS